MSLLLLACYAAVHVPSLHAGDPLAPVWPAPPDEPKVGYLGAMTLQGLERPLDVGCAGPWLGVVDPDRRELWVVDLQRERLVRAAGGPHDPIGISVDDEGGVWTVDAATSQVFHLASGSRRWDRLELDRQLVRPTAVARWGAEELVVVDTGGHQLYRVDRTSGASSALGPGRGELGVGFNFPVDVVASGDTLWVADALNAAVQSIDGATGALTFVVGGVGVGGEHLVRPKGLAIDRLGRVHVVDGGMQHVQVYDPATRALLGRYGRPGDGPGELALPAGICINGDRVFVADSLHHHIQVYALLGAAP
jgi:sugar lactone lactonase YvrE